MKTILILCTAFLFAACACTKKAEKQLPPATQTGANTFGCTLNGQVFIPNKAIGITMPEHPILVYRYYSDSENESRAIHTKTGLCNK